MACIIVYFSTPSLDIVNKIFMVALYPFYPCLLILCSVLAIMGAAENWFVVYAMQNYKVGSKFDSSFMLVIPFSKA